MSDLIDIKEHLENLLILYGCDPNAPLYSLIPDSIFHLARLEIVLTHLYVFSRSARIRIVSHSS